MNANSDRVPPITGYAAAKWHVRSNGIEFVVMDQNCNTIATCRDKLDADFIAAGPELYTALRTLLNRYRIEASDYYTGTSALAKAQGIKE